MESLHEFIYLIFKKKKRKKKDSPQIDDQLQSYAPWNLCPLRLYRVYLFIYFRTIRLYIYIERERERVCDIEITSYITFS